MRSMRQLSRNFNPMLYCEDLSPQCEVPLLGAVHGSILNGPQGTQRGLLRLGQAPDARDIEALVGPVTPQRLQQIAALEIPDVDDTIIPATGEPAAIRAALERLDRPLMRLSHSHALSLLQVPPAQHAIAAATKQHHAGRAPGQRIHDRARLAQGVQALPTLHIPDEELLTITASATTGQPRPIGTPGHAHDHATMPLQRSSKPAVGGVPQEDATIIAATGQARPVRTPLDTAYPGWQPTPDPPAAVR